MTNLLAKTQNEVIEAIIRNRTASFTLAMVAEWTSEQGFAAQESDVLAVIAALSMKGVVRRESVTDWTKI